MTSKIFLCTFSTVMNLVRYIIAEWIQRCNMTLGFRFQVCLGMHVIICMLNKCPINLRVNYLCIILVEVWATSYLRIMFTVHFFF